MPKTQYAGINYGDSTSNTDTNTGIRYGIISQNSLMPEALDDFQPDYGKPSEAECPECGNTWFVKGLDYGDGVECPECDESFELELEDSAEPNGHTYESDGYACNIDSHGDVWVFRSPFYTYAQFCSPCAPGAGHLNNTFEPATPLTPSPAYNEEFAHLAEASGFPKVYCLGDDWFEGGKAPYPLFAV
jgi:hypothetical protein